MTEYASEHALTKLTYNPDLKRISVQETRTVSANGYYADLTERQLRELALEILSQTHDITYPTNRSTEAIKLTAKVPPRPLPRVGEYYRVRSVPTMMDEFQGNPIVRIESAPTVKGASFFVRTAMGEGSRWYTMDYLEGPIDVRETVAWVAK